MKKIALILTIIMFSFLSCNVGCKQNVSKDLNMDMNITQFMKLDLPLSCKMSYVCWKTRGKTDEKSACEKYSIPCAKVVEKIDEGVTKGMIEKALAEIKKSTGAK